MTNAEIIQAIKAEIERLNKDAFHRGYALTNEYFDKLLSFISDLESEKTVPNDLEEAAVDIADALLSKPKDYVLSAKADYWNGAHDGIIAGAKWQKEQMISALKNDGDLPIEFIDKFHEIDRTAFQNGQANMKEKMMKEAAEGEVVQLFPEGDASIFCKAYNMNVGDKVRVIICKKED